MKSLQIVYPKYIPKRTLTIQQQQNKRKTKTKQPDPKLGKGSEQTFPQGRYTNGQSAQGNANQNYNEVTA